ncbi:MAG: ABC transporter permease [Desulfobacteraceae bacterium]|nr:MAG: ABC transporter permease [Desulfobacteraceae bacterium]
MQRFLRTILTIVKRELKGYFESPVAYVFIFIFLALSGYFAFQFGEFYIRRQANLDSFFKYLPWLFIFLIPAVTMRLWAEERRTGTIELIMTLPVTLTETILGKFLASWLFMGLALALTAPLIFTVTYLGDPDLGALFAAYFGGFLMAGAYLSIGLMTSALTRNQVIAFIVSAVICLFLVLIGMDEVMAALSGLAPLWLIRLIAGFSFMTHFGSIYRGVIDLRDVVYFLSVIFLMLFLNGIILQNRKAA